ncbi:MAG: Gfo/Idh/MocA family oxidoreductase [Planctomycetes bacterium]|nr:Gfo/Idh/MocA family oxidoreductase [Planctomycetota bacterium]
MHRREFLSAGAAGLATSAFGGYFVQAAEEKKLRVGLIGCGWYGKSDLCRLIQVTPVEVVSLCDVDQMMLTEAADLAAARQASKQRPRTYGDYREMLKEKDLDMVLIGTPDHWHALQMIAAVEAGADVYVQKPISVDVAEGAAMVAAARKHGRVVQVGTQRKSTPRLVECRKNVIQAGLMGSISHAEVCCYYHMRANGNPPVTSVPSHLDYGRRKGSGVFFHVGG